MTITSAPFADPSTFPSAFDRPGTPGQPDATARPETLDRSAAPDHTEAPDSAEAPDHAGVPEQAAAPDGHRGRGPALSFAALGVPRPLVRALAADRITEPFPIQ